ncbi:MAG: acyl carrier protein [Nitrospiraceae bacterium]|nr:acyl carrier protein [Nitrospiraceae bacterium]
MQIRTDIRDFLIENFLYGQDGGRLKEDVSLLETGLIDSTGILELVSFIEDKYGVTVNDNELVPDNFDSINKLAHFILKKIGGPGS